MLTKEIDFSKKFQKNYKKRISSNRKLSINFEKKLDLFKKDRNNIQLRDHQLKGKLNRYRAFSLTGNVRIIYIELEDQIIFVNIGTHSQVYDM
jgi:addiction module RelE/StbE family toxin